MPPPLYNRYITFALIITLVIIIVILHRNNIYEQVVETSNNIRLKYFYDKQLHFTNNFFIKFHNIININSNNFPQSHRVNISKNKKNEYSICNLIDQKTLVTNIINYKDRTTSLYNLIKKILPLIHINNTSIDINRCVVVDLIQSANQPFPTFHTDIEWGVFNQSDGFQIWYLYENEDSVGNMFILDTEYVMPSTYLYFGTDDSVEIRQMCGDSPLIKYPHYTNINPTVKYLDMSPGECLIFGKNLYHRSDHRVAKKRRAITFRVIITDPDGGIGINNNVPDCAYSKNFNGRLAINGIKKSGNRIFPKMFDLISTFI